MALPEAAAVAVAVTYLAVVFRHDLTDRYAVPERTQPGDLWTFRVCAVACVALAPGVMAGAPPWAVATPCAAAAVGVFGLRRRGEVGWGLVPWRIIILTEGLFLVVTAVAHHGLTHLLATQSGGSVLRTAATAGVAANTLNNLPPTWPSNRRCRPATPPNCSALCSAPTVRRLSSCGGHWRHCCGGNVARPEDCTSAPPRSPRSVSGAYRSSSSLLGLLSLSLDHQDG